MGILWIRIPIEIRSIQTIPSPNQQSACPQDTLPHTKPKTQGATAQPRIPFIRKSPDLKHQENFSKGTTQDKISVKHPAQGLSGDWPSPLTVFLYPNINKSPQGICPAKKCQYKLTGFWEFPRISSILSCLSATVCLRARAHSCA